MKRPHLWSYHKLYGNPVDVDAVWADRETTERVGSKTQTLIDWCVENKIPFVDVPAPEITDFGMNEGE
jgi:hypothetical protein